MARQHLRAIICSQNSQDAAGTIPSTLRRLRLHQPSPLPGHKAPQPWGWCSMDVWAHWAEGMKGGLSWNSGHLNPPCSKGFCSPGARVLLEGIFSKLQFAEGHREVEHQHLEELSFHFQSCRSNTLTYLWEQSAPPLPVCNNLLYLSQLREIILLSTILCL